MYKRVGVILLLLFLAMPFALATVEVTKTVPNYAKLNEPLTVTLKIASNEWVNIFDVNELIPNNWTIIGWTINNYDKYDVSYESTNNYDYEYKNWSLNHWRLNKKFIGTVTIEYTITPERAGTFESKTAWTYEGGFGDYTSYSSILPVGASIPKIEEQETKTIIEGVTVDVTLLTVIFIIGGFVLAALIIIFFSSKGVIKAIKKIKEGKITSITAGESADVAVEDLRAFIKLGLKRGYTLREMVNALKGGNVDTTEFNEIAKEEMIKTMDLAAKASDAKITTAYSNRLRKTIEKLKYNKR